MKKYIVGMLAPLLLMGSLAFGSDTLVVIDNKLVRVESVVDPKVNIAVPVGTIDLGEIVKLEANLSGEVPTFVKEKKFKWTVTERGYVKQFWEQDNWVIFGTGVKNTTIRVTCEVTLTYQLEKEEVLKKIETVVDLKVGTPDPEPPTPGPDPKPPGPNPPGPNPPAPEPELSDIAKIIRDWGVEYGPSHKAQSAPIVAKVFKEVATRIGHDTSLKTPRDILINTKKEINETLAENGFDGRDWDPWGNMLQNYMYEAYQKKELTTADDYKAFWLEAASGMAVVK